MTQQEKIAMIEYIAGATAGCRLSPVRGHLRISRPGNRTLDFFPKSGRATWLSSGKWFEIEDVEKFLYEHFKQTAA